MFSGKFITFVIRFIIPLILVRVFNKEEYGTYRQMFLVGSFLIPILQMGMASSVFFFFPNVKGKESQLFSQTFIFLVLSGLLSFPILYLFEDSLVWLFKNDTFKDYIFLCASYSFFTMIAKLLEYVLILEKRTKSLLKYLVWSEVIRTFLMVMAIILFKTIESVFISQIVFQAIITLILFFYINKRYGLFNIRLWNRSILKNQIKYSFPLGFGEMARTIGKRANGFILNAFLTASDYAIYTVGSFRIPLIKEFYSSIARVTRPKIAEFWRQGKHKEAKDLWHKQIVKFYTATFPIVVFFFIMAHPIITFLYTMEYEASVNIFRILIIILFLQASSWGTIPKAYNATKFIFWSNTISMIVGVPLAFILIRYYGLYGAAIAAVFTFFIDVIMQIIKSKTLLGLSLKTWLPWKDLINISAICLGLSLPILYLHTLEMNKIALILLGGLIFFIPLGLVYNKVGIMNLKELYKSIRH